MNIKKALREAIEEFINEELSINADIISAENAITSDVFERCVNYPHLKEGDFLRKLLKSEIQK